jgi:hypothetical protein
VYSPRPPKTNQFQKNSGSLCICLRDPSKYQTFHFPLICKFSSRSAHILVPSLTGTHTYNKLRKRPSRSTHTHWVQPEEPAVSKSTIVITTGPTAPARRFPVCLPSRVRASRLKPRWSRWKTTHTLATTQIGSLEVQSLANQPREPLVFSVYQWQTTMEFA